MRQSETVNALRDVGALRVWSLLITILGDIASERSQEVPGPWLTSVFKCIGVSPEALRVAVHRLKKDEWIASRKDGRISYYSLTDKAQLQTQLVWELIYHTDPVDTPPWLLCVTKNSNTVAASHAVKIQSNVYAIRSDQVENAQAMLTFKWTDQQLPTWLDDAQVFSSVIEIAQRLNAVLSTHAINAKIFNTQEQEAIRFLVLHYWRVIALKNAAWLHMHHVPDSVVYHCYQQVKLVLNQFDVRPP